MHTCAGHAYLTWHGGWTRQVSVGVIVVTQDTSRVAPAKHKICFKNRCGKQVHISIVCIWNCHRGTHASQVFVSLRQTSIKHYLRGDGKAHGPHEFQTGENTGLPESRVSSLRTEGENWINSRRQASFTHGL